MPRPPLSWNSVSLVADFCTDPVPTPTEEKYPYPAPESVRYYTLSPLPQTKYLRAHGIESCKEGAEKPSLSFSFSSDSALAPELDLKTGNSVMI